MKRESLCVTAYFEDKLLFNALNDSNFFYEKFVFYENDISNPLANVVSNNFSLWKHKRKIELRSGQVLFIFSKKSKYYVEIENIAIGIKYKVLKPTILFFGNNEIGEIQLIESGISSYKKKVIFYEDEYFNILYLYIIILIDYFDVN